MKNPTRFLSLILAMILAATLFSACGDSATPGETPPTPAASGSTAGLPEGGETPASEAPDTIKVLLPPITKDFHERLDDVIADFSALYPHLTLEIETASWDDRIEKLDTQVNAGSPPDIAFLGTEYIAKYVDMGVAMDITPYATPEMLADYDPAPVEHMKNGDGLYGFPAYMEIHGLGGNKEYMEKAGLDWKAIQQNGWTFDEFAAAVKIGNGVAGENSTSEYGLVFATSGAITKNYIEIFSMNAGIPHAFDADNKYAYTSKNFLTVLEGVQQLMGDGANLNATAGERWNLFLTGKTMFTGKGLATFETMAIANNVKLEAGDGSAVEDSVPAEYVVMPVPTANGASPAYFAVVDGYMVFRGKTAPTDEHMRNVVKAAYFFASGDQSARINADGFLVNITESARQVAGKYPVDRNPENLACIQRLMENAAPARPDIPAELMSKATKMMDEVIVAKFQALVASEITPQQMYDAVYAEAVNVFGEDGIVKD